MNWRIGEFVFWYHEQVNSWNMVNVLFVRDIKKRNHQFTNSPIHEFKVPHKGQRALLKTLFNGVLFLISYLKKHRFFILMTFCSTLNSWIGEFVFRFQANLEMAILYTYVQNSAFIQITIVHSSNIVRI